MPGKYIRTEEIKDKQRTVMRERVKLYDFASMDIKRKETLSKNNTKPGRKPGDGPPKTGEIRSCPVCNGDVYYTKKEIQLSKVKCCSRACLVNYPAYRDKLSNMDKSYMKTEEYRNTKRDPNLPAYKKYANIVRMLSEENYVRFKQEINPNNHPRTLCGVDGGYQLDHVRSIKQCWNEGLDVSIAASAANLQIIPWKENLAKRTYEKVRPSEYTIQESVMEESAQHW
jgi:hypothetical protein